MAHRSWTWTAPVAYAVGLLATDGCVLSTRPITLFTSKDRDLVVLLLRAFEVERPIYTTRSGFGTSAFQTAIYGRDLHDWLISVGVMPRKSLTLGPLDVPAPLLPHLVRGLLDGDGSILSYAHAPNRERYPDHQYLRLTTYFHSASRSHIDWLADRLRGLGARGSISFTLGANRTNPVYRLQYGKHASTRILSVLYAEAGEFALQRKRAVWQRFIAADADKPARHYRMSR